MIARQFRVPMDSFLSRKDRKKLIFPLFLVSFAPNKLHYSRLGAVISNSVSKNSPRRHTIKRILLADIPKSVTIGMDIVFFVTKKAEKATRDALRAELARAWSSLPH